MSRNRTLAKEKRNPVPRGTCRWCGGPVAPPKRTFCSDACVHEWRIRSDPGYVRECLWKRDHGICAHCGLDTVAEARERYEGRHSRPYPEHWGKRGPWDADHIHPVHLGGGECGLEGYQTLCKDCHKAKSAREAAARAAAARDPEPDHPVTEESPVRYNTCPNHPGHIIESHPCPICGHPAIPPVGREPRRSLALVRNPKPEVEVQDSISTSTLESDMTAAERASRVEITAGGETVKTTVGALEDLNKHLDRNTGEVFQHTLDDTMFPAVQRDDVPMVKIGFAGTVEMTQEEFEAYCDQGLVPGRIVKVTMTGYLPDPHAKWVKRTDTDEITGHKRTWWEPEGAIKIKALELGRFELGAIYDGE